MKGFAPPLLEQKVPEGTIEDYTYETIDQVILSSKISPSRMSAEEKVQILKVLDSKGVFRVKGSMNYISKQLMISEPTLYRYLKEI
jgi:predicted transcriptional regulator YheO